VKIEQGTIEGKDRVKWFVVLDKHKLMENPKFENDAQDSHVIVPTKVINYQVFYEFI